MSDRDYGDDLILAINKGPGKGEGGVNVTALLRRAEAAERKVEELQARRSRIDRERLATAFRDWVHESPLTQCNVWADTCPDWPLAYELADIARAALKQDDRQPSSDLPDSEGAQRESAPSKAVTTSLLVPSSRATAPRGSGEAL